METSGHLYWSLSRKRPLLVHVINLHADCTMEDTPVSSQTGSGADDEARQDDYPCVGVLDIRLNVLRAHRHRATSRPLR